MSKKMGKTIQIFLPDGNPRGVKVAEFTNGTIQALLVPRAHLDFACNRPELANVGFYFLVGDSSGTTIPQLYVGEAEKCSTRLKQQNKAKDWWTTAIACVSKTSAFTKSHVKYLEWYCHQQAEAAGRFTMDNSSLPTKSHVPEPMEYDLIDYFETVRILTSTLGFPFFEKIHKPAAEELLTCKGKKAKATGEYSGDGLIVFSGSLTNRHEAGSMHPYASKIRSELIQSGVLEIVDDQTLRFTKDHVFPSPSQAAMVVLARNANGWIEWKYPDGRTLDEVKRNDPGVEP